MQPVPDFFFRHSKPRAFQKEFIEDAILAMTDEKIMLAHAGTGTGKTDSALSAALTYAHETDLTVFFLTPKISQHRMAVEVVNGIAQKQKLGIKAVDLIGRRYACIDPVLSDLDHDGFYQSCEKKRKNETCTFYGRARGFNKVQETKANLLFKELLVDYGAAKTHNEIVKIGEANNCCPYEWLMKLAGISNVIIADYYHFMIPDIRNILLLKTKKKIERSIVIVDEAHNLGRRVREHLSSTVSSFVFRRAEKEMKFLGAEVLPLEKEFVAFANERLGQSSEKVVSTLGFDNLLAEFPIEADGIAEHFESLGIEFVEKTNSKSALLRISKFIASWKEGENGVVRILRRKGEYVSLSKKYLDPSVGTSVLNKCHSALLMSGTLLPLEMHRDILGLDKERTVMKRYPSPFEKMNLLNIIAQKYTTKYSHRTAENYRLMAEKIDEIISHTPGGSAIFFPSYSVQKSVLPFIKSDNLLIQHENAGPSEISDLLKRFKSGGVLVGPQGGSLAEGVDYSDGEIKTAVIVGVALEEMSLEVNAMIDFCEEKFGRGWEYGYMWPAVIKAMQAAGRGIRKESDRCAVVYMDERFGWKNYKSVFDSGMEFIVTDEPERYVKEFWNTQ